ncbi:hypothetical protein ACFX2I_023304 [Malus domestica]
MDKLLCDELVQEIFQRLPPSTSSSVSLVSKRWLRIYRTSTTTLSLRLTTHPSTLPYLSSLLSHYPFLSSLSLLLPPDPTTSATAKTTAFADHLLFLVSSFCPQLLSLRPLFLMWVLKFPSLKELSVTVCSGDGADHAVDPNWEYGFSAEEDSAAELGLDSLCLSGIGAGDWGFGWLWRSCRKLRKLQLKSCEGIGDGGSFSSFESCLQGVQELELRTCRAIIDGVLLKVAENCDSLTSLLVYDGGSSEGLLRFFSQSRCNLRKVDFRLPLDLNNDHLLAVAMNFRSLSSIKLQSCCLVSGEGLRALAIAASSGLEELALVNCDVVEREPGLLATLGQNLRKLRKLDLSYNEMLVDKEFMSMLVSCNDLVDLRLRGCRRLTTAAMVSIFKSCKRLESVDIMHCRGIQAEAIEYLVLNSPQLREVQVEQSKISDAAKTCASSKFIEADA